MAQIISEGLEYIGRIDGDGYVFDISGNCSAKIDSSGYIQQIGGGKVYGKIDDDGTIRDSSMHVVGRIQADGYVYIHSKRVCKVSSSFVEKITPKAWNAGEPSTYSGRSSSNSYRESTSSEPIDLGFLFSPFFIKLIIGVVLGVVGMVNGWGGIEMLISGPIVVFLLSFFVKLFG